MKFSQISADDPMLTAYALGELDAAESAEMAAAIEQQPLAQQAVHEIRAAADELRLALKDEPVADVPLVEAAAPVATKKLAPVVQFPYYLAGAAAVAGVACLFALRSPSARSNVSAGSEKNSPGLVSNPVAAQPISATPADQVTSSDYLANVIPDGFSDLKPAPFRDAGYRLGKSIVSDDAASTKAADKISTASESKALHEGSEVALNDAAAAQNSTAESTTAGFLAEAKNETATSYELVPVAVSDLPSVGGKGDATRREQLTLKIRYQPPLIDVNRKGNIVGTGNSFAMAATHLKFSLGITGFGAMLKEAPQATTYEEVLSWSPVSDKSIPSTKRDDFIELVKKPANATVE